MHRNWVITADFTYSQKPGKFDLSLYGEIVIHFEKQTINDSISLRNFTYWIQLVKFGF